MSSVLGTTRVSLALQGGSSMGAYSWGVLDALLEDGRLEFEGVTGTSAGAINAATLADGLAAGGRDGARASLRAFWTELAHAAERRRLGRMTRFTRALRHLAQPRSQATFHGIVSNAVADFQLDAARMEPIRSVIDATIDFARLRRDAPLAVFVNATNVRTQEIRVFSNADITADAICASACLPMFFQAVEIDGEPYWDGSFLGNPAIFPVIYHCKTADIVLIETRPNQHEHAPRSAPAVLSRMLTITARAALGRELRMIDFVSDLVRMSPDHPMRSSIREIRVHRITPDASAAELRDAAGFRVELGFFLRLFELGRQTGREWIERSLPRDPMDAPVSPHDKTVGGVSK
jgi:NTE family protein